LVNELEKNITVQNYVLKMIFTMARINGNGRLSVINPREPSQWGIVRNESVGFNLEDARNGTTIVRVILDAQNTYTTFSTDRNGIISASRACPTVRGVCD
jgi:hypothetical protein